MFQFSCRLSCCLIYNISCGFPVLFYKREFSLINQNGPSKLKLWSDQTPAELLPNLYRKGPKGAELCKSFIFIFFCRFWAAGSWIKIIFPSHTIATGNYFPEYFYSSLYPYANVSFILICIAYLCKIARIWQGFAIFQILSFPYWSLEIESTKDQLWP